MFVGLRKPEEQMVLVVTLLASGCPVQAIVHALELGWRAGKNGRERIVKRSMKIR